MTFEKVLPVVLAVGVFAVIVMVGYLVLDGVRQQYVAMEIYDNATLTCHDRVLDAGMTEQQYRNLRVMA